MQNGIAHKLCADGFNLSELISYGTGCIYPKTIQILIVFIFPKNLPEKSFFKGLESARWPGLLMLPTPMVHHQVHVWLADGAPSCAAA